MGLLIMQIFPPSCSWEILSALQVRTYGSANRSVMQGAELTGDAMSTSVFRY
jgi:hypothetical protein